MLKIRVDAYFYEPESRKPPKTRKFLLFFCISDVKKRACERKVNEKRERERFSLAMMLMKLLTYYLNST